MNFFIPVVVLEVNKNYYLYPKVKCKTTNLIKLDETGYFFYQIMIKSRSDEEVIEKISYKFQMHGIEEKNRIRKDYTSFKNKLKNLGIYTEGKAIKSFENQKLSEQKYIEEFTKLQNDYTEKEIPFKYFIELTYKCNLKCAHCYRGEVINVNQNYLDKEIVFSILDDMEKMKTVEVIFTGGECFTHPNIIEILEYATHKNFIVTVLTNGNLIDQNLIKKIKNMPIFEIRVSIYGMEKKHDEMTKVNGSWKKSINALELINKEIGNGVAVYVITEGNVEDCDSVINFCKKKKIQLSLNTMITPTAQGNLAPTQMRIGISQYEKLMRKYQLPITGSKCTAGISRMRISPDGNVSPCELIPDKVFGNIYELPLKKIVEGNKRKEFNEKFKKMLINSKCLTQCSLKNICNFCPAIFLLENGDFYKPVEYICKMANIKYKIYHDRQNKCKR